MARPRCVGDSGSCVVAGSAALSRTGPWLVGHETDTIWVACTCHTKMATSAASRMNDAPLQDASYDIAMCRVHGHTQRSSVTATKRPRRYSAPAWIVLNDVSATECRIKTPFSVSHSHARRLRSGHV